MYARFITKVLHDRGHVGFVEPFARLFTQGMITKDGAKMSKNKGNVVSADEMIERFGADTGRVFELFAVPPEKDMDWTDAGAEGAYRFLGRVYRFVTRNIDRLSLPAGEPGEADRRALRRLHQTVKKVTGDFESRWHFNTSIAAIMTLVNDLYALEADLTPASLNEVLEKLVLMLEPFAPYVVEDMWEQLGRVGPVFRQPWPAFDAELAKDEAAEIPVQVNGKLRSKLVVPFGTSRQELERLALADPKVQAFTGGKQVVKIVVVEDKLVNVVVK
jgi:leucyl-tRNA synthetase